MVILTQQCCSVPSSAELFCQYFNNLQTQPRGRLLDAGALLGRHEAPADEPVLTAEFGNVLV